MYTTILYSIVLGVFLTSTLSAQQDRKDMTVQEYLDKFKAIAIQEMERSGIPASITLAQGIHESAFGNSELAKKSNNHFGIKCGSKWKGKGFYKWDDDPQKSCFRVYDSAEQSYVDHSDFLMHRSRYAFLFEYGRHEYKKWAKGLRKAGYATDPKYPDKLIHSIEKYQLTQYDEASGQLAFDSKNAETSTTKEEWTVPVVNFRKKARSFLFKKYKAGLYRENGSTYAISRKGESALALAKRFGIPYQRFLKFNDLKDGDLLIDFQPCYIQPKKNIYRGDEAYYIVNKDITMYEIAQCFGIKLATLMTKNILEPGEEPQNGAKIYLKEKAVHKPALRSYLHIDTLPTVIKAFEESPSKINVKEQITYQAPALEIDPNSPVYAKEIYADSAHLNTSLISKDSIQRYQFVQNSVDNRYNDQGPSLANSQPITINTEALFVANPSKKNIPVEQAVIESKRPSNPQANQLIAYNSTNDVSHLVKQGETLYRLHRLYNVSVASIKKANQLDSNEIIVGVTLKIPNK